MALGDANNRANLSPARPVGKSLTNHVPEHSFAGLMVTAGANPDASKRLGPPDQSVAPRRVAGQKRKAETTLEEDITAYKQNLDHVISPDAFEDDPLPSCNAVRGRINRLLDSGIMNKAEFIRAIGANSNSLNRFLQASGQMGGSGSSIYYNAWAWFRQREVAKLKMPDVKKRQKLEADAAGAGAGLSKSTSGGPTSSSASKTTAALPDIGHVRLRGEETDNVPIYDSCDEIRKKINAHLKTPGLTQAQFCRDLYAQLNTPKCKGIQSKQLADFRAMKGSRTGARSSVFYAAYVYFEKLRIAQGKSKSAHRENMEALWAGHGGLGRDTDHRTL
ncbi:hypothetical protein F4859DRAFT_247379 [Xylaria cf. heliscus]|nr:hypothetical protein F4859DRAFT_247379 [Xylaria cf. heliscus]